MHNANESLLIDFIQHISWMLAMAHTVWEANTEDTEYNSAPNSEV